MVLFSGSETSALRTRTAHCSTHFKNGTRNWVYYARVCLLLFDLSASVLLCFAFDFCSYASYCRTDTERALLLVSFVLKLFYMQACKATEFPEVGGEGYYEVESFCEGWCMCPNLLGGEKTYGLRRTAKQGLVLESNSSANSTASIHAHHAEQGVEFAGVFWKFRFHSVLIPALHRIFWSTG